MLNTPFVAIRARNSDGQEISNGVFKLPVKIGRNPQCQIVLPDEQPYTISRVHVRISQEGDGVKLEECSTNGTTYRGRKINRETIALEPNDSFEILGNTFEVKVELASHSKPVLFQVHVKDKDGKLLADSDGQALRPIDIGPCYILCLIDNNNRIKLEPVPHDADHETFAQRIRLAEQKVFFVIYPAENSGRLKLMEDFPDKVLKLNGASVEPGVEKRVEGLDLIEFEGCRLEAIYPGQRALRCNNCGRLNDHNRDDNCRWCGHHLVNSQTAISTPNS